MEYTSSDFDALNQALRSANNSCTLVTARAAILASSTSSLNLIKDFIDQNENAIILLDSKPYDGLSIEDFDNIKSVLGQDRVVVKQDPRMEWPQRKRKKENKTSGKVPKPDFEQFDHSGATFVCSNFAIISVLVVSYLRIL